MPDNPDLNYNRHLAEQAEYRRRLEGPDGRRAVSKASARVHVSGGMTFEHNPLTGDTIVSGVLIYEPLAPGKIRLSSKRRGGSAEIAASG